jgi:hypothetical protein
MSQSVPSSNASRVRRTYFALFALFVLINLAQKTFNANLMELGINREVLWYGNTVVFLATLVSVFFLNRSLVSTKALSLLKNIYLAIFIKMLICMVAAAAYILTARKLVDKAALAGSALLYIIYTALELYLVLKTNRTDPHAPDTSTP